MIVLTPCATKPVLVHGPSATKRISASWDQWRPSTNLTTRMCESDGAGNLSCSGGGSYFLAEAPPPSNVLSFATTFGSTCALRQNGEFGCWGRDYAGSEVPDGVDLSTFTPLDISGL